VLSPAFSEDDFNRIRTRTLNALERSRRYNRDEELSKELLFREAYRGTPYEHPVDGYVQSVRSITLDDVKQFYRPPLPSQQPGRRAGGRLSAGVRPARPLGLRRAAGGRGGRRTGTAAAPHARRRARVIVEKETDATAISMGFPIPLLRGEPDFIPLMTANSWFGEHRNSFARLYQVIRETRGMNYGDYSYIEAFPAGFATQQPRVNVPRRSQLFEIWIRPIALTEPGNLHDRSLFATRAAWRELQKLVDTAAGRRRWSGPGVPAQLHGELGQHAEPAAGLRHRRRLLRHRRARLPASIRPSLAALTPERVNDAIRRNLQYENMYVVFITATRRA
jgi:zinc protease